MDEILDTDQPIETNELNEFFIRPMAPIDVDIEIQIGEHIDNRYTNPPPAYDIPEQHLKYEKAREMAKGIRLKKNSRFFCFVSGNFIFGDFIEALIVQNNWHIKRMDVSTLSMGQNNIDSLANLINGNYVEELNLIISDYFFQHERNGLIKYAYQELDIDNKFQLAVASSHAKIVAFETYNGGKVLIHGSANLRSSSNIEQMVVEENEHLYTFVTETNQMVLDKYATIQKSIRHGKLWQTITKDK